jgi:hypothetical protein
LLFSVSQITQMKEARCVYIREGGGRQISAGVVWGKNVKKEKRQMSTVMCERQNIKDIPVKIKKKLQKGG